MSALLQAFGLSNNCTWTDVAGQTVLPARTRLVTFAGAPEGMLLKRIASIEEAFQVGGLFMYDTTDPTKWQFVIRDTLAALLHATRLGEVTLVPDPAAAADGNKKIFRFYDLAALHGERIAKYANDVTAYKVDCRSGHFRLLLDTQQYFGAGVTIGLLGVVTSANVGYGHSTPKSKPLSYFHGNFTPAASVYTTQFMASLLPMSVPFKTYLASVKAKALELVPANLRTYYESTFDDALATYANREAKPTISVPTFWKNGLLADGEHHKPVLRNADAGNTETDAFPLDLSENWVSTDSKSTTTWINNLGDGYTENVTSAARWRVFYRAGFWGVRPTILPLMDSDTAYTQQVAIPKLVGTVAGLKIGLLRDGHVLKRAIVDQVSFQDEIAELETLDQVVNLYIDPFREGDSADLASASSVSATDAETAFDSMSQWASYRSIYQMGTLPQYLSEFSDWWDRKARTKAKG